MSYDIPDKIQYREKIVFGLDLLQILYAVVFGLLAYFSYRFLPIQGDAQILIPAIFAVAGFSFIFFNGAEKAKDAFKYADSLWLASQRGSLSEYLLPYNFIESNALALKDGDLRAVLRVFPVNYSLMDDDKKRALIAGYREFLNHLTYPVQIFVKTVPVDLNDYYAARDKSAELSGELEKDLYEASKEYELDFVQKNDVKEREYYLVISCMKTKNLEEDIARLDERVEIAKERLRDCGIRSTRLSGGQVWRLLDDCEVPEKTKLYPDRIDFGGDFQAVIKADGYPRKVEDGWLQPFLCKNEPYNISIHIKPSSISDSLVYLHKQIVGQSSDLYHSTSKGAPNPSLEIKLSDTRRLHDSLYKGEEKMFRVSLYLCNRRKTWRDLNNLVEKCKSHLNSMLIIPTLVKLRVLEAAVSVIPVGLDRLNDEREFPTTTLAATFPFLSNSSGIKEGILFAHEEETKTPIFLSLNSLSNKHFFVIGTSGSGKSYTAKYLTLQSMLSEQPKTFILDPNAEYAELCKSFGGENVKLSRESDSVINVFDLAGKDLGEKLLDLITTFDIIVGGLTESQKGVLNEALPLAYREVGITEEDKTSWFKTPPTFTHVYAVLQTLSDRYKRKGDKTSQDAKRSIDVLLNRVRMYRRSGFFGFLDRQTKLKLDAKMINFDLSELPAQAKPLMMFTVMEFLAKEIKKDFQRKNLIIDEGWALLRSKEAENYLLEFIKTSRKYNASIGFITQEIEDLTRSETGRSVLNLASTKILMRQNASNIEEINRCVRLNQAEKDYLLHCHQGYGLLITENMRQKFFTSASPKVHKMITTNPNERDSPLEKPKEAEPEKPGEEWFKQYEVVDGLLKGSRIKEYQVTELEALGYRMIETSMYGRGGFTRFFVKPIGKEGDEHAFLCRLVASEAKKQGFAYRFNATVSADVEVTNGSKTLYFEVETGTALDHKSRTEGKFTKVKAQYKGDYIILVAHTTLESKYRKYGPTITRKYIAPTIQSFFSCS